MMLNGQHDWPFEHQRYILSLKRGVSEGINDHFFLSTVLRTFSLSSFFVQKNQS